MNQLSVISKQLSVVSGQWSVFSGQRLRTPESIRLTGVFALGALLLLLWPTMPCAAEGLVIRLKSEAAVSSQNYTVAEVAEYVSGERSLWQLVAAETAGVSPRTAGQRTQFGAARLLGILAERGYDWQRIAIEGAAVAAIQLAEQSVPAATVIALLENETSERLGVPVEIITATPFPDTILPQGNLSIHVHFPDKPGYWLPDAVEFLVDGRLVSRLPLTRLKTNFKLTVIVAPGGITARTLVHPGRLGAEEQDLPPGSEVATRAEQVTGMTTRAALRPGERLRLSQLQAPYDVSRGSELTLVIAGDGITLHALAIAMNNAYIGQSLVVKRVDDNKRYTGRLIEGPMVVLE